MIESTSLIVVLATLFAGQLPGDEFRRPPDFPGQFRDGDSPRPRSVNQLPEAAPRSLRPQNLLVVVEARERRHAEEERVSATESGHGRASLSQGT
jgi:hypothetical protein